MWFKNLTIFRLDDQELPADEALVEAMGSRRRPDCGPLEAFSVGFVSPFGANHSGLLHSVAGYDLIALGQEKRVLPPAVVQEVVADKARAIEEESGRPPGKRRRRELAEAAMTELLPKAFIVKSTTLAYVDRAQRLLVVDSTSDKVAEAVATEMREALGSFPAIPLAADSDPSVLLTAWLAGAEPLPADFELGEECELRDPGDTHTVISARGQDLTAEEIREHLKSGKQVSRLGLIFDQRIGLVLDAQLKLRKLRFLDLIQEKLGEPDGRGAEAELDARFALMTHELARLFARLDTLFGFAE
ncbi:MAG: recombination-associated protein RdgC [Xanthomonadales bacterium]|nr:recombination-associated protein RdgC [Xanthomonadales bacterium]